MRTVDPSVEAAVKAASPLNLYGQPIFRVIWSPDSFDWAAGWWNDYDSNGTFVRQVWEARYVPRYHFTPRWIVERWMPPEFFGTKELWEKFTTEFSETHGSMLELGPYPAEGKFLFVWKCENADGSYLEITPTIVDHTIMMALLPIPSVVELRSQAETRKQAVRLAHRTRVSDMLVDEFPFLGRPNNLNPRPLLDKIRAENKRRQQ